MSGAAININLNELKGLNHYFNKLEHANLNELLEGMGALIAKQTVRNLKTGKVDSTGKKWQHRQYTKPHPLLENTGHLLQSIHYVVKGRKVEVGSNLKYAATHQYGDNRTITRSTKAGRSKAFKRGIPKREFLYLSNNTKRQLNKLIIEFYKGASK